MGISQSRDFLFAALFFMIAWIAIAGLSYSQNDPLYSTASNLCGSLVSVLPIVSLIGAISSGLVYAFGQFSGSEMRARAAVWAATLLAGSLVSAIAVAVAPPVLSTMLGSEVSCQGSGPSWFFDLNSLPACTPGATASAQCSCQGAGACGAGQKCCSSGACVAPTASCPSYSQCGVGQQASQTCICGTSNTCSPGQYCCSDNTCKSDCYPACSTGSVSSQQCRCNGNQVCSSGLTCCSDGTCKIFCSCPQSNTAPLAAECTCGPSASICYPSQYCCSDGTCGSSCVPDCAHSDTSPITSQCKCGGMARTSGYCCADGHYDVTGCYDQCASGFNVFDCKCGTSGPVCTSSTGRYCCYGGTCQSGACSVACTDGQQGSCKCGTGAVCTTSQYCYLAGNTCVPSCSEGSISSACKCGSGIYSSGFCCSGTHQSATCAVACSEGAIPSSGCLCNGVLKTSGYCCSGTYSATYSCCAQNQQGYCQCGQTLCNSNGYCDYVGGYNCRVAPACTNNAAVTSICKCGSTIVTSGYCCNSVPQATNCYNLCTTNLQQNCVDTAGNVCYSSVPYYYYTGTSKCVGKCPNGQITSACYCAGAIRTYGYCYNQGSTWQSSYSCATQNSYCGGTSGYTCCSGLACKSNHCCIGYGMLCSSTSQCCSGYSCRKSGGHYVCV
ncbi:MAG: hypothetical protein WC506_06610 [Candidatus Micrarchaeia archaeon]